MEPCDSRQFAAENTGTKTDWLPLVLLSAIVGLVPMIVYMHIVPFEGIAQKIYGKSSEGDFFSYYKYLWLCIFAGSAMLWFFANRKAEPCWYHKPIVVYCFFAIVSTILARHRDLALFGDPCRHEGLFVHLSYMATVFLFINLIRNKREQNIIVTALLVSASFLAIVGALQFFGHDYLFSNFSIRFLIPNHIKDTLGEIDLNKMKTGLHSIFLTFGNGNFTGSYMAMLFALSLALLIRLPEKWRYVFLPLNLLIYLNLMGSKSRAGQLAGVVAFFVLFIFMRRTLKQRLSLILLLIATYAITPFALDAYTWRKDTTRFLSTSIGRAASFGEGLFGAFRDLKIEKDQVIVDFDGVAMKIKQDNGKIDFYDHKEELIPHYLTPKPEDGVTASESAAASCDISTESMVFSSTEAGSLAFLATTQSPGNDIATQASRVYKPREYLVVFPEKKLRGYIVQTWPGSNLLKIGRGGNSFYIIYTGSGFKLLDQHFKPTEIKEVESFGFKGREGFASNRGYIWSRSIPLVKQTILLGFGPDTFAAHFPNDDFLGKLRFWGSGIFQVIEKPHNVYLQIAINTGLLSLLAILALWGRYILDSVRLYWNSDLSDFSEISGLGIFAAVTAYLVAGLFNDSVVSVAPVFWGLLGLGIAANRINSQSKP